MYSRACEKPTVSLDLVGVGSRVGLYTPDPIEDGLDHRGSTDSGVDHEVVEIASRPILLEIAFYKGPALAIDGLNQLLGLSLALPAGFDARDLFFARSIKESVKGIGA